MTERKQWRHWVSAAAAALCACSGFGETAQDRSQASSLTLGGFEGSDGNLVGSDDWATAPGFHSMTDPIKGAPDTTTYPGGKKENDTLTAFTSNAIPPNKTDFVRFYVASEIVPVGTVDHVLLYLSYQRSSDNGDVNLDFEFNQNPVVAPAIVPVRKAGDILITYDVAPNGAVSLGLLRWLTSAPANAADGCFTRLDNGGNAVVQGVPPCWGKRRALNTPGVSEGAINAGAVTDPKNGGATIEARRFGEAAIDLTAAGATDPSTCTALNIASAHSRSSESFDSTLQDFVGPLDVNITTCRPTTLKLKKTTVDGTTALAGAEMQLFHDLNSDGVIQATDPQVAPDTLSASPPAGSTSNCITTADGIGNCIFTITESGKYIAKEIVAPPGYTLPNPATMSQQVTLTSSATTLTLTFQDGVAPGTIVVEKKDEDGHPIGGAVFELFRDLAPKGGTPDAGDLATSLGTCTTNAIAVDPLFGKCVFSGPDVLPGDYWVKEVSVPAAYEFTPDTFLAATVPLGTQPGQGGSVTVPFTNARIFRIMVLVCTGDGKLHPSTITVDALGAQTSISAAQALTAGTSESELCAITQARFGELHAGAHTGAMTIP